MQLDIDPVRIGLRYPVEVGLVGDSRRTLEGTSAAAEDATKTAAFLQNAQEGMKEWSELMDERGTRTDMPMKPQVVAHELGKRLPDNAIVSCDSGTIATWWARHIPVKRGQMHSISGTLATMACGLPYAIAAQVAYPDRPCIAFVGDGGFSMLMAEFVTAVKYKLPIKVVIIKNNTLGQIKWEQMVFLGNPEFGCDLQPIDFAAFARACGGTGFTIEDPGQVRQRTRRSLGQSRAGHRRGGRRSVRAAHAAQGDAEAGLRVGEIAGTRRAGPRQNRRHDSRGQGQGNDLGNTKQVYFCMLSIEGTVAALGGRPFEP